MSSHVTTSRAAIPDQSLTVEQYVAKGAPPVDRPWAGKEYSAAIEVMKKIATEDPATLPRLHGQNSAKYFEHFISPENQRPLTNQKMPTRSRLALGLELVEGPKQLALVYLGAAKPGAVFDDEVVELLGYQLQTTGSVLDLFEQFVKERQSDGAAVSLPMDSVTTMRDGVASLVDGCLITTADQNYRIESRRRMADLLAQNLPRLAVEFPRAARDELPARLTQLAQKESDPSLKVTLQKLSSQASSLAPSRIDAAIASLKTKPGASPRPTSRPVVWSWHTSTNGGFRAEFPGTPDEQTHEGKTKAGTPMHAVILGLKTEDGSTYTLIRIESDARLPDLDSIDRMLAAMFPQGKVLDKSEFDAPVGRRGRQMLLRTDRGVVATRVAFMKGMLYQAIVESPGQTEDKISESAKRFLESFEITGK